MTAKEMVRRGGLRGVVVGVAALLSVAIVGGCASRASIEDASMEAILREFFVAQCMVEQTEPLRLRQADSALEIYEPILTRHGYTMQKFDSMLSLYSEHPARLDAILDHVIANVEEEKELLSKFEVKANAQQEEPFRWQKGWGELKHLGGCDDASVCCEPSNN